MSALKRWFWVILAWFGLPGDFHWWWTVGFPTLGAAAIDAVLYFVREAPPEELILAFLIVYIAFLVGGTWWRRSSSRREASAGSGPITIIEYANSVHVGQPQAEQGAVVLPLENRGPVSVQEWAPDGIERTATELPCVVPYKPYATDSDFFNDPAGRFEVKEAENIYLVTVSYEVRGDCQQRSPEVCETQINVGIQLLGKNGEVVREYLEVYVGKTTVSEGGRSWHASVSDSSSNPFSLPQGDYGLNVLDFIEVPPNYRGNAHREYRDMRLTVRKL